MGQTTYNGLSNTAYEKGFKMVKSFFDIKLRKPVGSVTETLSLSSLIV